RRQRQRRESLRQWRAIHTPEVRSRVEVDVERPHVLRDVSRGEDVVGALVASLSRERRDARGGGEGDGRQQAALVDHVELGGRNQVVEVLRALGVRDHRPAVASDLKLKIARNGVLQEKGKRPLTAVAESPKQRPSLELEEAFRYEIRRA